MLGLSQQIGGAELAIHAIVRDHQRFGRACQQIDSDAPEELSLRLRNVGVTRTDDHIHGIDSLGAKSHGRYCLDTAETVDFIGSAQVHGDDDSRARCAFVGRRCSNDAIHTGDFGCDDAHVGRCHHWVLTAWHIAPDTVNREVLVPKNHPRQCFHLDVPQRILLCLGKVPDLSLRKFDVFDDLLGELLMTGFYIFRT